MNWKSFCKTKSGKIKSGQLSREMTSILPIVMFSFLSEMEKKGKIRFTISELSVFIRLKFPDIEPIVQKIKKSDAAKAFPRRKILDIQNSCYHLSKDKSYWIQDQNSDSKVIFLEHHKQPIGEPIDNVIYEILPNWREHFIS